MTATSNSSKWQDIATCGRTHLVDDDDELGHAQCLGQLRMLARLTPALVPRLELAFPRGNDEHPDVRLRGALDHVGHIVLVAWRVQNRVPAPERPSQQAPVSASAVQQRQHVAPQYDHSSRPLRRWRCYKLGCGAVADVPSQQALSQQRPRVAPQYDHSSRPLLRWRCKLGCGAVASLPLSKRCLSSISAEPYAEAASPTCCDAVRPHCIRHLQGRRCD